MAGWAGWLAHYLRLKTLFFILDAFLLYLRLFHYILIKQHTHTPLHPPLKYLISRDASALSKIQFTIPIIPFSFLSFSFFFFLIMKRTFKIQEQDAVLLLGKRRVSRFKKETFLRVYPTIASLRNIPLFEGIPRAPCPRRLSQHPLQIPLPTSLLYLIISYHCYVFLFIFIYLLITRKKKKEEQQGLHIDLIENLTGPFPRDGCWGHGSTVDFVMKIPRGKGQHRGGRGPSQCGVGECTHYTPCFGTIQTWKGKTMLYSRGSASFLLSFFFFFFISLLLRVWRKKEIKIKKNKKKNR